MNIDLKKEEGKNPILMEDVMQQTAQEIKDQIETVFHTEGSGPAGNWNKRKLGPYETVVYALGSISLWPLLDAAPEAFANTARELISQGYNSFVWRDEPEISRDGYSGYYKARIRIILGKSREELEDLKDMENNNNGE